MFLLWQRNYNSLNKIIKNWGGGEKGGKRVSSSKTSTWQHQGQRFLPCCPTMLETWLLHITLEGCWERMHFCSLWMQGTATGHSWGWGNGVLITYAHNSLLGLQRWDGSWATAVPKVNTIYPLPMPTHPTFQEGFQALWFLSVIPFKFTFLCTCWHPSPYSLS